MGAQLAKRIGRRTWPPRGASRPSRRPGTRLDASPAAGLVRPVTLARPARALHRRAPPEPVAGHVHQGSADDRRSADGNQPNDGRHRDDIRNHGREQLARSTPVAVSRFSSQGTILIYPWQLGARPTRASPGRLFRQLLPQRLDHEVHQRCVGANAVELQLPVQRFRNPRRELNPRLFTTIRHFRLPLSKACT